MAASLLMEAGMIPARMGSWFTGVTCRVPEIVCRALLRVKSSFGHGDYDSKLGHSTPQPRTPRPG